MVLVFVKLLKKTFGFLAIGIKFAYTIIVFS